MVTVAAFWPSRCSGLWWWASLRSVIGPRPSRAPRNRHDLEQGRVTAPTAALRVQLLEAFQTWMAEENLDSQPLPELARWDPIQLATVLEEYGRVLYEQGAAKRNYAKTINAILQRFPYVKSFLSGPWNLLTTWESLWPGKVHPPIPLPLLRALVTTALAWRWTRFAMVLLLGFYGLLRPCEVTALKVKDCLLAAETGCQDAILNFCACS